MKCYANKNTPLKENFMCHNFFKCELYIFREDSFRRIHLWRQDFTLKSCVFFKLFWLLLGGYILETNRQTMNIWTVLGKI